MGEITTATHTEKKRRASPLLAITLAKAATPSLGKKSRITACIVFGQNKRYRFRPKKKFTFSRHKMGMRMREEKKRMFARELRGVLSPSTH